MTGRSAEIEAAGFSMTVSDFERSKRFYCEGLGFKTGRERVSVAEEGSIQQKSLVGIPTARLRTCFMSRPYMRLEIKTCEEPKTYGDGQSKPTNQTGLNALYFACATAE